MKKEYIFLQRRTKQGKKMRNKLEDGKMLFAWEKLHSRGKGGKYLENQNKIFEDMIIFKKPVDPEDHSQEPG